MLIVGSEDNDIISKGLSSVFLYENFLVLLSENLFLLFITFVSDYMMVLSYLEVFILTYLPIFSM